VDSELEYPELLALWRTVPMEWRKLCRKEAAALALDVIQNHKPGIRLTSAGKPTKYVHKRRQYVAVGPALALILDRPELARLKGGQCLAEAKANWDYQQNRLAEKSLKRVSEACLGYGCETVEVNFWDSNDLRLFRIRSGHRGRALRAIERVLSAEEFNDIWMIAFRSDDDPAAVDLAADPDYWP